MQKKDNWGYELKECYIDGETYLYTYTDPDMIGSSDVDDPVYIIHVTYWRKSDPDQKKSLTFDEFMSDIPMTQAKIKEEIEKAIKAQKANSKL